MTIFMVFDRGNFYCLFLPWHFTFWLPWQIYLKHHGNCVAHTTSFSLNLPWHLKIYTTTILFMRYNTWHHKLFWDDHVAIMDFFDMEFFYLFFTMAVSLYIWPWHFTLWLHDKFIQNPMAFLCCTYHGIF